MLPFLFIDSVKTLLLNKIRLWKKRRRAIVFFFIAKKEMRTMEELSNLKQGIGSVAKLEKSINRLINKQQYLCSG
ncbi:hypothetical protein [Bacillus cereus]|uniref:Uncharacterized protein n=1 Tax=Bacillus cereus TaxID=1396 RepID=A0AA44TF21_BACCE|nr:hypothetical protein [Bacillus cereus]PFN04200.1 hypothetical protein COJ55_22590 [Bacillus cereus]PFS02558.1 hypothetical protein COK38_09220 [Bacillus cereus]